MRTDIIERIGVCGWSLQPENPGALVENLKRLGIKKLQCAIDPLRENPGIWNELPELCAKSGVEIVSGMFGCAKEDYSTLESIRRTGGIVPDETWEENLKNIKQTVEIAKRLNLKLVTFHSGFIPHNKKEPVFEKLVNRLRVVAGMFSEANIELGLETGQETAETLLELLDTLNCKNVVVNFDPANMILYDKGDPIEALKILYPHIRQFHLKDAIRTKTPGVWGEEVRLGAGEVNWKEFFRFIIEKGFSGNLCIEREAGNQRIQDIRDGYNFVKTLIERIN